MENCPVPRAKGTVPRNDVTGASKRGNHERGATLQGQASQSRTRDGQRELQVEIPQTLSPPTLLSLAATSLWLNSDKSHQARESRRDTVVYQVDHGGLLPGTQSRTKKGGEWWSQRRDQMERNHHTIHPQRGGEKEHIANTPRGQHS